MMDPVMKGANIVMYEMKKDNQNIVVDPEVELEMLRKDYIKAQDELETVNAAYSDSQKEISTLKKQLKRKDKRLGILGSELQKAKNEIIRVGGNHKIVKKENRYDE